MNELKLWDAGSERFAQSASGEVRALLGSRVSPMSTFSRIEQPALESSSNVLRIIEVPLP